MEAMAALANWATGAEAPPGSKPGRLAYVRRHPALPSGAEAPPGSKPGRLAYSKKASRLTFGLNPRLTLG
jgi:hypothetical protein